MAFDRFSFRRRPYLRSCFLVICRRRVRHTAITKRIPPAYPPASLTVCTNDARSLLIRTSLTPSQEPPSSKNANGQPKSPSFEHPFWDRENDLLFAAVGASRTLDYFSTLNFRRRGRNEALLTNDIVDNHSAFASIEAAATVASIGMSYLFHRTHHHRLERWTSIVHASLATSGAVRNYCLKTAHP